MTNNDKGRGGNLGLEKRIAEAETSMHIPYLNDISELRRRVPRELQELPQWVGWRVGNKRPEGKIDKIPVYSKNRHECKAMVNNPDTWMTFDNAITNARNQGWDGIGFVVTKNDNITGIDIDDCISDGTLTAKARDIIDSLDSYTEASPSGTGIRIFVIGDRPTGTMNRRDGLEVYDQGRFLTITGNVMRDRGVEPRQEQLSKVCNKYLKRQEPGQTQSPAQVDGKAPCLPNEDIITLLQRENSGACRLFSGDTSGYPSQSEADLALCCKIAFYTRDPQQIDGVFHRSSLYRDKWERHDYRSRTIQKALDLVTEQYQPSSSKPPRQVQPRQPAMKYELSDLGDACRVADRYGEDLLRTVDTKKWYRWRKTCWERIDKVEVENLVAETTEDLIANPGTSDPDLRAAIRKHAIKSQSTNKIEAISKRLCGVAVDRGDRIDVPLDRGRRIGIPIYSEVLDGDLDLIGTPIGPIDLRTGRLLQPQRGFLITKSTSVSSDSSVPTPLWDSLMRFVCDVPGGGPELEKWIQTTFGYFLTGHNTEQVFFILWGRGCNAKSTVIQAVGDILGDYTKAISQETLMASSYHKGGEARSDLAKLQGARYIPAVESSQQGKLDEVTVKLLTGGDYIVARALYQEEKQFRNQGKLILATNNKPAVREFTHAMWRRIRLIPFTNQVEDPDPLYGERLKDEYAGILAWMVEGARLWYENGLGIHPIVGLATADYADEMDTLAPFFDECCEIDPRQDWYEPIQHLHARYTAWCESIGTEPISTNAFSRYVTQKFGLESKHVRGQGRVRRGIRIIGSDAQGNTTVEVLQGEMC